MKRLGEEPTGWATDPSQGGAWTEGQHRGRCPCPQPWASAGSRSLDGPGLPPASGDSTPLLLVTYILGGQPRRCPVHSLTLRGTRDPDQDPPPWTVVEPVHGPLKGPSGSKDLLSKTPNPLAQAPGLTLSLCFSHAPHLSAPNTAHVCPHCRGTSSHLESATSRPPWGPDQNL